MCSGARRVCRGVSPLIRGSGRSPAILVVVRLELGENIDQLANPPRRQRPAGVEQRIVIDDPSLGFG